MGNKAILNRVNKIKELEAQSKEIEAQINALKDELKTEMISNNQTEIDLGSYIVRYKEVISNKFDATAFKKVNEKLYNAFLKPTSSMRFTIN